MRRRLRPYAGDDERAACWSVEVSNSKPGTGVVLVASGDPEGARQAYQEALKGVTADSQAGRLITAKMNMTRKGDDG